MHYMFRTVFPSIIRGTKLHIQLQTFIRTLLLPAASLLLGDGRKNNLKHVQRLTEINTFEKRRIMLVLL